MSRIIGQACSKTVCLTLDSSFAFKSVAPCLTRAAAPFSSDNLSAPSSLLNAFAPPRRTFCVSQSLAKLHAWDKKKFKGRKPRSLGRAPTKLELVDPEPTLDDEEQKLLAQWTAQYHVDMTHCYDLMKEKSIMDSMDTGAEKLALQEEKLHHAHMMKENEEWNEEVGAIREREFADLRAQEQKSIQSTVVSNHEAQALRRVEVLSFVDRLQVESDNFITLDNLEEKVNEALDAPVVDYNFSIDRNGKQYRFPKDPALLS